MIWALFNSLKRRCLPRNPQSNCRIKEDNYRETHRVTAASKKMFTEKPTE